MAKGQQGQWADTWYACLQLSRSSILVWTDINGVCIQKPEEPNGVWQKVTMYEEDRQEHGYMPISQILQTVNKYYDITNAKNFNVLVASKIFFNPLKSFELIHIRNI